MPQFPRVGHGVSLLGIHQLLTAWHSLRRTPPGRKRRWLADCGLVQSLEARTLLAATTIDVTTLADVVDENDGLTSLREAVITANAAGGSSSFNCRPGSTT